MRLGAGLAALTMTLLLVTTASASHDVTELVSIGPTGGNGTQAATFRGASSDGSRVFFTTSEKLVAADTDSVADLYERSGSTTTLLSTGPTGGNGAYTVTYSGNSQDGTKVFFRTGEKLVGTDTDSAIDIYMRSGGTTTLLSLGPNGGNGPQSAIFKSNTDDGNRVFFETAESLISSDTDVARDVYQWASGTVTRLSTGPAGGNDSDFDAFFERSSADGSHVFLSTTESLVSTDTDATDDVYERFGSTTTQLSIGPAGGNGNANFDYDAFFDGASADGSKVWLETDEALTADDTDINYDVYERSGGTTTRISTGPAGGNADLDVFYKGNSTDGTRVFFDTIESLVAGDDDFSTDIYERSGGTTTLVSTGPGGLNGAQYAFFDAITGDGLNVFFTTSDQLTTDDTDLLDDVYQRAGGTTTRVSASATAGNADIAARYSGASADGTRVFFATDEQMVSADTDAWLDLYERNAGTTTFISKGPNSTNQDFLTPIFRAASQDGLKVFFDTPEPLLNTDTDIVQDTYASTQGTPGGFPRPKGATPVRVPLAPAFTPCSAPNRAHAGLPFASCNPPAQTSPWLTVGTPDANGAPASSNTNSVQFRAVGVAGGPDDSDVQITATMQDIRNKSDLTDYAGELQVLVDLNITDKDPVNALPSTLATQPLSVTVPCTPTGGTTNIGSTCGVTTTADTLIPGMVPEGRRIVWGMGKVRVYDGGPDDSAATADNSLFQTQAIFVP